MLSKILIIDKRKELSTKYRKSLELLKCSVSVVNNLKDSIKEIQFQEPDMILVSDSIEENLSDFCEKTD